MKPSAQVFFSRALERIEEEERHVEESHHSTSGEDDDYYYHGLSITVRYNKGRLHEAQGRSDLAEEIYKSILLQHPSYIDCESVV